MTTAPTEAQLGADASATLRDALLEDLRDRLGDDAAKVIDYCATRRPDTQTEIEALQYVQGLILASPGGKDTVVTLATLPPAMLDLSRRIISELLEKCRVHTKRDVDDPMTIREVRRTVRHHLEKAARFARPILIAELVERHVHFANRQLAIESGPIILALWKARSF